MIKPEISVVNLSLATVIYIHMDPAGGTRSPNQMQLVRRYFEELLVPSKEVEWRLIGFKASPEDPDDPLSPRCEQCSKHVLDINALDENLRTKITDLHHEEGVANVENKRKRKIGRRSPEELQRDSYADLISHIVVLANMDLTPHSHAVGKVMKQLYGSTHSRLFGTCQLCCKQ